MSALQERTAPALLARNTALYLGAEVLVTIILLVTVPPLVHRLGPASFGLYSLAIALINYLGYFDLGVSRAATQFVSVGLAQNDTTAARRSVHTAILVNLLIGLICSLALIFLTPLLIRGVFKITPALEMEARLSFYAVALAVPVFLLQGVFRSVLMSYQRFGVISVLNSLSTSLQFLAALFLAFRGFGVGVIVFSAVAIRLAVAVSYAGFLLDSMPGLLRRVRLERNELGALLHFGGWVTVSQLILQMLVYLDRFFLASFLSLDAVTLYSVPYEGITRLRVIPASVMATLYPAMSEHSSDPSRKRVRVLYDASLRYLLLLLLPGMSFLLVFGKDVLSLWMGMDFAVKAAVVLQALAAGFFLNSLAYVSYSVIQAFRKPDIVGKFHLFVSPIYIGFSVLLILRWGIAGAAFAAALRFTLDALLLFWVTQKYCGCSLKSVWNRSMTWIFSLGLLLTLTLLLGREAVPGLMGHLLLAAIAILAYFFGAWRYGLNAQEKPAIVRALNVFNRQATV